MYFFVKLLLSFLCFIATYLILKTYKTRRYFAKWGIPQLPELPFLGVMFSNFFPRLHLNNVMINAYNFKKEAKYIGCHLFTTPTIVIRDPELIKSVRIKNFDYFAYRKPFVDETMDPLFGKNLTVLNGEKWREVRNLLSPAFTSSKMKTMHGLISRCAKTFSDAIGYKYANEDAVDMKDAFNRYANDAIATCAFGIEVDSITNPTNDFYVRGKEAAFFQGTRMIKLLLIRGFPHITKKLGVRAISQKTTDYFVNLIDETMKQRLARGIRRPDMLQLMMDARETMNLSTLDITAQAFLFFLAGLETSALQMCLLAHELAVNPDVQKKLQNEIDDVMASCNGEPSYEAINNMVYLDAVFSETLRVHPTSFLNRMCNREFELPATLPSAKPFTIQPGMEILIPVPGIHMDPVYYANPELFDPNRFLEKKAALSDINALGFGLGPRMCIANRFAILEGKIALVHLLAKCNLLPCQRTCVPFEYDVNTLAPMIKGGFWLKIESRN